MPSVQVILSVDDVTHFEIFNTLYLLATYDVLVLGVIKINQLIEPPEVCIFVRNILGHLFFLLFIRIFVKTRKLSRVQKVLVLAV